MVVQLFLRRKGKEVTLKVNLGELIDTPEMAALTPDTPLGDLGEVESLGLELAKITPELRERFQLEEATEGVVITEVKTGSSSAEKGLRPGDVIVEVDQEEVKVSPFKLPDVPLITNR